MKEKIQQIIYGVLIEINEEIQVEELKNPNLDTKLYGSNGLLDSLNLVNMISEIEVTISDELDANIVLTDEKAMSQNISPFRTVRSLAAYIEKLLEE